MTRPAPPPCDRDRSPLSLWWDAVPQRRRVMAVFGTGVLFFLLAGVLARL